MPAFDFQALTQTNPLDAENATHELFLIIERLSKLQLQINSTSNFLPLSLLGANTALPHAISLIQEIRCLINLESRVRLV